jgi:hypothetical protein
MTYENKTRADAFGRISQARTGSLVGATDEYLEALREEVAQWRERVEREIFERSEREMVALGLDPEEVRRTAMRKVLAMASTKGIEVL